MNEWMNEWKVKVTKAAARATLAVCLCVCVYTNSHNSSWVSFLASPGFKVG